MNEIESLTTMNNERLYVGMSVFNILPLWEVGCIVEKKENGQMAEVPIYLVYIQNVMNKELSERLWKKIPSSMCSVTYKVDK